ncbi:cilia- and flagella-associated protein 97 [Rhipicephalus sanguineus]|uniref:cilia- and flagella-associated protein 97 n=1 Tax=Rhipicephalus sanguineus TaxID=34632 RepID=UPI0018938894|nr:cilia- and flagella-associated protein 97 [Rhipicephalus sanguineus]
MDVRDDRMQSSVRCVQDRPTCLGKLSSITTTRTRRVTSLFSDSEAAGSSHYIQGDDVENNTPCNAAAVGSLDDAFKGANSGLLPLESSYRLPSSSFYARRVTSPNVALTDMQEPRNSCMEQDGEDTASSPRSSVTDSEGLSSLSEGSMEDLSESESITDVTPLHSPYMCDSPVPAVKLPVSKLTMQAGCTAAAGDSSSGSESDRSSFSGARRKSAVAAGKVRLGSHQREPVDLQLLVDAIRRLEAHQCEQSRTARKEAPAKGRKNMSFSNEEVQRIDRENQRLLKRILAQQNRPRPKFDSRTPSRLAPSAINRQRQQRQIEVENLALLKRIESAKPSREVAPSQDHVQRARSHSLSLTRHTLQTPPVMAAAVAPPLSGVKHFPPRQKHHSH